MTFRIKDVILFEGFASRLQLINPIIDLNLERNIRNVGVDNRLLARAAFNLSIALISICSHVLQPHHERYMFNPHFFYSQ